MVSVEDVQQLARNGRVAPHPAYHAHQHAIRFDEVVTALAWCLRVEEDDRTGEEGSLEHPDGYLAWCPYKGTRVLRVDFALQQREDGDLILVVTAFEVDQDGA